MLNLRFKIKRELTSAFLFLHVSILFLNNLAWSPFVECLYPYYYPYVQWTGQSQSWGMYKNPDQFDQRSLKFSAECIFKHAYYIRGNYLDTVRLGWTGNEWQWIEGEYSDKSEDTEVVRPIQAGSPKAKKILACFNS